MDLLQWDCMRRARPLLLVAILAILGFVAVTYRVQKSAERRHAPVPPKPLPVGINATADRWSWSSTTGHRPVVQVWARSFKQIKEPSLFDLVDVELHLFDKQGKNYDKVESAHATFDMEKGVLYSDGAVDIHMGVTPSGAQAGRLVDIRTSGVTFESKTGRAYTDQLANFTFDQGEGKAVGAIYDPTIRQLHLRSYAEVTWRKEGSGARPMKLEAGELVYRERDAVVLLAPWSRLTRDDMVLEAGNAAVWLNKGTIDHVEAQRASGTDQRPGRKLDYSADNLSMKFAPNGEVTHIAGGGKAKVVSTTPTAQTTATADRLDLMFDTASGESELQSAFATGHSTVQAAPLPSAGAPLPETRILRSEVIELRMAAGGKEIASAVTHAPAVLEFLPHQPGQRKRTLEGEQIAIRYAPGNKIRDLRAANAATRTEPPQQQRTKPAAVSKTWSKELIAEFDAAGSQLARVEQKTEFRYEEGERRGRANRAVFDAPRNVINLYGGARLWDPAGSTAADHILLNQATGDMIAEGNVASTHAPEKEKSKSGKDGSPVLAGDEPMQAKADRMVSTDRNRRVRYEGNALLWQGGSRIRADWVEIDRDKRRLLAAGNVASQFLQSPAASSEKEGTKGARQVVTVVRAPELEYTDETRLAYYRGGARLTREALEVKAAEIRAYLAKRESGSDLEKAFADGNVEILHTAPDRTRRAEGEHAEYYPSEQKMVLHGGEPLLVDSVRGSTRGNELTWFADNDSLLVDGRGDRPVVSRILRK